MGTVLEIEDAVQKLSPEELVVFREWFLDFDTGALGSEGEEFPQAVEQGWSGAKSGDSFPRVR